jgi:hypothetical protein
VSLLKASQITGKASASTLAITGSSMPWAGAGARATLSRTSAAAVSGPRQDKAHGDLALLLRLMDVMTSTPSMPAIESSSGLVTCDSITSLEAPV